MGIIAGIVLAALIMPFYGVHMFIKGFEEDKAAGVIIAVVGVILAAAIFK